MYYSLNNEKQPEKLQNLPDTIIGAYIKPRLVGRKVLSNLIKNNPVSLSNNKFAKKYHTRDNSPKSPVKILSRISLNNSIISEDTPNIKTLDVNSYYFKLTSPSKFVSLKSDDIVLPLIKSPTQTIKKIDTIERDYIKTEETLKSRYKLQRVGLNSMFKNIVKSSFDCLSVTKLNRYDKSQSISVLKEKNSINNY
jgi:hypothetical protein